MTHWTLTEQDLEAIAIGAGVLGTGGGGNSYLGLLRTRGLVRAGKTINIVRPCDLADDALVLPIGGIGAPTVGIEKLDEGGEALRVIAAIERVLGRKVDALIADEIGGSNGFSPMIPAAELGLPVVDADGMGRAFPETQMTSFFIGGQASAPAALADARGTVMVVTDAPSANDLEHTMRAATIAMGCTAMMSTAPMSGAFIKAHGINLSVSLAKGIGMAVINARRSKTDPVAALNAASGGRVLVTGKAVDIARTTTGGFARGVLTVEGMGADKGRSLTIDIQNEFIVAREGSEICAMVPDLICIVDSETGRPVSTEELRYGLRVSVLCLPAPRKLRSEAALKVVGPRAFGYDFDFHPMGAAFEPTQAPEYTP